MRIHAYTTTTQVAEDIARRSEKLDSLTQLAFTDSRGIITPKEADQTLTMETATEASRIRNSVVAFLDTQWSWLSYQDN